MKHNFEPCPRGARLRATLFASLLVLPFAACNPDELTDATAEDLSSPAGLAEPISEVEAPSFANSFRGGIPIGTSALPTSAMGERFTGALRNIWPRALVKELAAVKARGGRVVLMFAGNDRHYKDRNGHFDLGKWKARVDRFKNTNFTSFINDGTVIGHYMIDEPNDPANWRGKLISPAVLEEMARYSKQRWPGLPTIVRAEPSYLNSNHRYLDAAWAQYVTRKGTAADYLRRNVADAQKKGLGLIVGMNLLKGGNNRRPLTARQVKEWGSTLLSSSYPCAFLSWQYDKKYLSRSDMGAAMSYLAAKARSKTARSCGGGKAIAGGGASGGGGGGGGNDNNGKGSGNGGSVGGGSGGNSSAITLRASGRARNRRHITTLTWSKAKGATVFLYRNGYRRANTRNDGRFVDVRRARGKGIYVYKVCQYRSSVCSKPVRVVIR